MAEPPPPRPAHVYIGADDLADIIRDELYALQATLGSDFPNGLVTKTAQTIVRRALLSPR